MTLALARSTVEATIAEPVAPARRAALEDNGITPSIPLRKIREVQHAERSSRRSSTDIDRAYDEQGHLIVADVLVHLEFLEDERAGGRVTRARQVREA